MPGRSALSAETVSPHPTGGADAFVYVIGSDGAGGPRTYVGWTNDLERRLAAHNAGTGARSTRGRQWRLLYAERHPSRNDAMRREAALKKAAAFRRALRGSLRDD